MTDNSAHRPEQPDKASPPSHTAQDAASPVSPSFLPGQKTTTELSRPTMYDVVLLNDDFTPMDFVVMVLKDIFHRPHQESLSVMLQTHHQGRGHCGTYTRDVAETKMIQVIDLARRNSYPLRCIMVKS